MFGNCSGHWVRTLNASFYIHFWVLIVKKKKVERDIKYNEKDTFTPIFNGEKAEVGNGGLINATSSGLSDKF